MIRIFLCLGMALAGHQIQCAQVADVQTKVLRKIDKKLYKAVLGDNRGNLTKIRKLLEKGASPDAEIQQGTTILLEAINKDLEPSQCCCFFDPTSKKSLRILEALIKKSTHLNFKNQKNCSALLLAILYQDLDRVKLLVTAGAAINDSFGNSDGTVIIQAIMLENYEILHYLIKAGAQFYTEYLGLSHLEFAAAQNDMRAIIMLLNAGAIPRPYFCQLVQEDTRFSQKQELKEALRLCQQRLGEYTQKCIASISAGSDLLPELVKLITEYTITAAPARELTEVEMRAMQPILDEIAACKQIGFDVASQKIDHILENLEEEKRTFNVMQTSYIEDVLEEYKLYIEKIELQDNAKCVVM